ncbi:MAG: LysM peptidoglycan-binding domain-containing protein [Anaerolineae bacterium]|jgi:LysM repeat protein|nr:hypothetical protein [Anaerolineae bacterium]MCO6443844.1 LysM peptidoglycan-binding domain-containing protein [Anaerolineae bacterium]MDL1917530.1 LysM peptidoglycan-binding domain-containing protein [Anaerolineae bacterium CFX4]GIK30034.1 MAG: hypothetical protein BroJett007_31720 [Chloroflexota bacterium]
MATPDSILLDAFNDCIDQLASGQSIEVALSRYPHLSAELRPMLMTANAARGLLGIAPDEARDARNRVRARVLAALDAPAPPLRMLPPVRRLLAAAAVVLIVGFIGVLLLRPPQEPMAVVDTLPAPTETPTPTPTPSETGTATATSTGTATATDTATVTETASPTPSDEPTATYTATITATATESPTPSPTGSPTATITRTPSATRTPTSTRTPTRTPTLDPNASPSATAAAGACVPERPTGWITYRVRLGDTLSSLAVATGTTIQRLIDVNCLTDPDVLVVGVELFLPRVPQGESQPPSATNPPGGGNPPPTAPPGDDDDDDDDGGDRGDDDGGGDDD